MRLDIKVAIIQSGRPPYTFAQALGIPESRLSKFIHGYGTLQSEQVRELSALLRLEEKIEEVACERDS